jgi:hypothetical protein
MAGVIFSTINKKEKKERKKEKREGERERLNLVL